MKTIAKILLAAGATVALAAPSFASTQATNFTVNANVAGTCTVSANNLSFGSYTGAQDDVTSTVGANCTTGTAYTLSMSNGNNYAGGSRRVAAGGGNYLNYAIYTDAAHTTNWDTTAGHTVAGTGNGAVQSINMYGSMPAGQTGAVGTYNDTITVTITY